MMVLLARTTPDRVETAVVTNPADGRGTFRVGVVVSRSISNASSRSSSSNFGAGLPDAGSGSILDDGDGGEVGTAVFAAAIDGLEAIPAVAAIIRSNEDSPRVTTSVMGEEGSMTGFGGSEASEMGCRRRSGSRNSVGGKAGEAGRSVGSVAVDDIRRLGAFIGNQLEVADKKSAPAEERAIVSAVRIGGP